MALTPDTGRLTYRLHGKAPARVLVNATTPTNNGRFPFKHRGSPFIGLPPAPGSDFELLAASGAYTVSGFPIPTTGVLDWPFLAGAGAYTVTGTALTATVTGPGGGIVFRTRRTSGWHRASTA
jgi:hypothetical protein